MIFFSFYKWEGSKWKGKERTPQSKCDGNPAQPFSRASGYFSSKHLGMSFPEDHSLSVQGFTQHHRCPQIPSYQVPSDFSRNGARYVSHPHSF